MHSSSVEVSRPALCLYGTMPCSPSLLTVQAGENSETHHDFLLSSCKEKQRTQRSGTCSCVILGARKHCQVSQHILWLMNLFA